GCSAARPLSRWGVCRSRSSPGQVGQGGAIVVLGTPPLSSCLRASPSDRLRDPSKRAFTVGGCVSISFQSGRTCTVWVPERLAGRLAPSVPGCAHRALPHWSSACVQLDFQHSGPGPGTCGAVRGPVGSDPTLI